MNKFKIGWILFLKKMFFYPNRVSSEHTVLWSETMTQLQEFVKRSQSKDKMPFLEENLLPYGMPMGINDREVLKFLRNFKVLSQYDLSVQMNHLYQVYFVKMRFIELSLIVQFHLIDNQLYLSRTEFLTRLNSHQYECFLDRFIGLDHHLDSYTGILPYYVKDSQSTLLRIHNSKGYPSVTYYSGDKKVQTKIENIIKKRNQLDIATKPTG